MRHTKHTETIEQYRVGRKGWWRILKGVKSNFCTILNGKIPRENCHWKTDT
jgi:hypothetical protein